MEADLWKKVDELFQAAMARPPEKRTEFLDKACRDDSQLRAEVQSLLNAAPGADSFLEDSPVSVVPSLKPSQKIGHFVIVTALGRGGMGEVWKAHDLRLERDVAIKVLPVDLVHDPDRVARLEREARAASALNHPNIVSVHEIGNDAGVSFIVTELVEGETLARVMGNVPLALRKLIEAGAQICEGLAAAHAAGVIHRDLKPGNIMLTRDGRVKILDFGLAIQHRAPGAGSMTMEFSHPGVILGTPGYMSPEQVRGEPIDARSDLFSMGVILYEMASGKRPFHGATSVDVMNSILKDEPPELPPASPPALERIIRRCLEKQPSRRFQSAADLGFALQSLFLSPVRSKAPKNKAWWKWAALVAACVITGAVYWLGVRSSKLPAPSEFSLRRVTTDASMAADATISPDGKLIAYSRVQADSTLRDIWVQQVDGGGAIRITDDPADDYAPAFSADGTQIAFTSTRQGGGVWLVATLGGVAREFAPGGSAPSFSPDGRWLMYYSGPRGYGKILVQPIAGGQPKQIGTGFAECSAVWSPDGSRILFLGNCDTHAPTAWVSSVDGKGLGPVRGLGSSLVGWPARWIANPSRLLMWKKAADAYVVMEVSLSADGTASTGATRNLTSFTDEILCLSAALDGRIAVSVLRSGTHLWGLPIDADVRATGAPKQLTSGAETEAGLSLSRDSRALAFALYRGNGETLFYKDLTTGRQRELSTADNRGSHSAVFDPDGTGLLWTHRFVEYVPVSGGVPRKILDREIFLWDWAPDGKTLLTNIDRPGKPYWGVVKRLDLGSQSETTFLDDPGLYTYEAHFSHDGRWVTFNATPMDLKWSRIYVVPYREEIVPRSEWIPITGGGWEDKPQFSVDDKRIVFVSGKDGTPHRLWTQKLSPEMRPDGKPVPIDTPPDNLRAMTSDDILVGSRLIVFGQADSSSNLWLLEPSKRDVH